MIKTPINDEKLEMALLGLLLMSKDALYTSMPRIFEEIFYSEANRAVFRALRTLYDTNSHIDIFTLYAQIKRSGEEKLIEGPVYLTKLESNVTSNSNLDTHINILLEYFIKRNVSRITHKVNAKSYESDTDAFELMNELTKEMEVTHEKVISGKTKDIVWYGAEVWRQYNSVKETGALGLKTGIADIDKWIGGLVAPDLIVIAARPGQGKTALALSITHNVTIQNGIPGAWFSFEMDGPQLFRRLASISSGLDHGKIKQGFLAESDERVFSDHINKITKTRLFIEDNSRMTIGDIRAKALFLHKKHGIQYIVVDYLQLITSYDQKANREQVVADISRNLKILAKELNIPVIALSQLNRGVENRSSKLPNLADLRESGAIEQDADEVIFIMRPEYYGMNEYEGYPAQNLAVLGLDKNRHGQTGIMMAHFNGPKMQFSTYKQF